MSRELKRAARDLRRVQPHLSHAQALHELARTRGYSSWQALRAAQNEVPALQVPALQPTQSAGAFINALSGLVLRALLTSAPGGNPRAFRDALLSGAATWADLTPVTPDQAEMRGTLMTIKASYTHEALELLLRRVTLPDRLAEPTGPLATRVTLHAGGPTADWEAAQIAWIHQGGDIAHWNVHQSSLHFPGSRSFEPDLPGYCWGDRASVAAALLKLARADHAGQDRLVRVALYGAHDWAGLRDALTLAGLSPKVQALFPTRLHQPAERLDKLTPGTWLTVRAPGVILPVLQVMLTSAGFPVES